jgi:hypothetical protein
MACRSNHVLDRQRANLLLPRTPAQDLESRQALALGARSRFTDCEAEREIMLVSMPCHGGWKPQKVCAALCVALICLAVKKQRLSLPPEPTSSQDRAFQHAVSRAGLVPFSAFIRPP